MNENAARLLAGTAAPLAALWTRSQERRILRRGKPLPSTLLGFASELGIDDPTSLRIECRSEVATPLPAPVLRALRRLGLPVFAPAGIALGRAISVCEAKEPILRHELVHVRQYQELGGHRAFLQRYLLECLRFGYARAPLEREARETAGHPKTTGHGPCSSSI